MREKLADDPLNALPGKGQANPADQEMRKLQRELDRVKQERDLLKKALAYFAEDLPSIPLMYGNFRPQGQLNFISDDPRSPIS